MPKLHQLAVVVDRNQEILALAVCHVYYANDPHTPHPIMLSARHPTDSNHCQTHYVDMPHHVKSLPREKMMKAIEELHDTMKFHLVDGRPELRPGSKIASSTMKS